MKGNRPFAVALLVVLLGLLRAEAHAGNGMSLLGTLPEGTSLVATWNMARSRLGPAGTMLIDAVSQNPRLDAVLQKLPTRAGIDWQRDVDTVVLGLVGDFAKSGRFVLMIEGQAAHDKLAAAVRKGKGFAARQHQGITYYQRGQLELAVMGGHWVIARKGVMTRVIAVFQGKAPSVERNRALMRMLRSGDLTQDLWSAFVVPKRVREEIAAEAGGATVEQGMVSVDFEDFHKQVRARVRLGMSSRAAVVALGSVLRVKGSQDETIAAMGLTQAVRTMTVSRKDNNLDLTLKPVRTDVKKLGRFLRTWDAPLP